MEHPILKNQDLKPVSHLITYSPEGETVDLNELLFEIAELDEEKAFSIFFKLYHAKMLLLARIFVSSPQVAEDVVSDVLVKLLRNRRKTFRKKNFLGFLYTCIKNQSLDYLRKNKKRRHLNVDDQIDFLIQHKSDPCKHLIGKEFEEIVLECIEGLPPRRKLVYKMIKDDRLTYKQVAALLDISVRTVEVQLRLAVKHLKITIDDYLACKN